MIPRKHPLLRGIPDTELEPRFAQALRDVRAHNRTVRMHARRLLRATEQYMLAELYQYPEPLRQMRRLAQQACHLLIALYPYAMCPECEGLLWGSQAEGCPLCHGLSWVDKATYWEWRKQHAQLPEPTTPSILDRT